MIEQMPLYSTIERVLNELAAQGLAGSAPLSPEQLFPFDQIHYHGTAAVQRAIDTLQLGADHHVVEIGSGLGGPARFMAHSAACSVTAIELQPRLHDIATDLTRRCGLDGRVHHLRGDALSCPLPDAGFDAVVSWLAVHHIPERPRLLQRMADTLRPGGRLYLEDLYARSSFTAAEAIDVDRLLYGVTMTMLEAYRRDLEAAGFSSITVEDTTDDWSAFCAMRAASWNESRERQVAVHGEEIFATLDRFFAGVAKLFRGGNLGGVRIVAVKA